MQNKPTAPVMTSLLRASTQSKTGRYQPCSFFTMRSEKVSLVLTCLLRNTLLAIGTYVSDRMKAPNIAKNTVRAIGLNIFPSMPTKVISGT